MLLNVVVLRSMFMMIICSWIVFIGEVLFIMSFVMVFGREINFMVLVLLRMGERLIIKVCCICFRVVCFGVVLSVSVVLISFCCNCMFLCIFFNVMFVIVMVFFIIMFVIGMMYFGVKGNICNVISSFIVKFVFFKIEVFEIYLLLGICIVFLLVVYLVMVIIM